MSPAQAKMVGPVVRGVDAELAEAMIEAIEADNPHTDVIVEDRAGYVRISVPTHCRMTRASLEEALGRSFELRQLEPSLSSFAGRIRFTDDAVEWYLDRED